MKRRGELIRVGSLFDKYKNVIRAPQASVITVVIEVVEDVCGFVLLPHQVSYIVTSRVIVIKAPGVIRHEVLRRASDIILHCRGRLGEKNCPLSIL